MRENVENQKIEKKTENLLFQKQQEKVESFMK